MITLLVSHHIFPPHVNIFALPDSSFLAYFLVLHVGVEAERRGVSRYRLRGLELDQ